MIRRSEYFSIYYSLFFAAVFEQRVECVAVVCLDRIAVKLQVFDQRVDLLGIRDIRLGPTLPAFISPDVLNYLVENFSIAPITTPEEDLKQLLK